MGKINYNSNEIEDRLRQVDINRNDIGMIQINVLPLPEGVWDDSQVDIPDTMELTTEGDKETGTVTVSVSGTAPDTENLPSGIYSFKLSPTGRGTGAIGIIKPGKYLLSLGGSASVADMPWQLPDTTWYPKIFANVIKPDSTSESYDVKCFDEPIEVVIPEDVAEVEIQLYLYFDWFTNVSASCELFPFLRLKELQDEPFEPYKPDLQTQITSNSARTADALGTDGSINLFPIDKGEWDNPVISDVNIGFFVVMQANSGYGWPSVVAFAGESTFTTAQSVEYKTFINCGYRFGDDKRLWGDLVPGDYTLSFDIFGNSSFFDVGKFRFEVYAKASMPGADYGDLIATCTGAAVDFTVTAEKPYILIVAVAERLEGHSWNGAEIYAVPFLRRKIFSTAARDEYQPPIKKQLAEIRYQISAMRSLIVNNVIQTDKITDTSEEGPLT
jgi:hypothetical protein